MSQRWFQRSPFLVIGMCGLLIQLGCRTIPAPQRRSVEEIYYEALQAKPEATLGLETPRSSLTPEIESVAPVLAPPALILPPDSAAPLELQLVPPLPANTGIPLTPPAATMTPISHSQNIARPTGVVPASSTEKAVSDIFAETDVREAIQSLASQAGVVVVLDDTVRGEVTCTLENETFEQALKRILLPLGYVFAKKDNMYLVGSNDPISNLFSHIAETLEYYPRHLSPQELLSLLPSRQSAFVRIVEKRNVVLIEAPAEAARQIFSQLQKADQPIPQIMIEAIVCVVSPDKGLQFGFDWNHGLQVNGLDKLNVGLSGLSFTGAVSPDGVKNAFSDFAVTSAFVKLLAREGYVTIRAAPRVMAKDGEKAEISIARDTFFSLASGNNQFLFSQNIQKVEAGISLLLTPSIRGDNVQIVIEKAEVSEDIRTTDPSQNVTNNPFPIINRRRVTTTVQVKDQQTVVIGGLMGKQTVDRETRIPVLGSLPLVGNAFRRIEQQEQETEVAIFISPKIVIPTADFHPVIEQQIVPLVPVSPESHLIPAAETREEAAPPRAVMPVLRTIPHS